MFRGFIILSQASPGQCRHWISIPTVRLGWTWLKGPKGTCIIMIHRFIKAKVDPDTHTPQSQLSNIGQAALDSCWLRWGRNSQPGRVREDCGLKTSSFRYCFVGILWPGHRLDPNKGLLEQLLRRSPVQSALATDPPVSHMEPTDAHHHGIAFSSIPNRPRQSSCTVSVLWKPPKGAWKN